MTADRRLYSMELGRRDHTRWLGVHRPSADFWPSIPNQLLRVNSREGSLVGSGSVLTSVLDRGPSVRTMTIGGSPVYTASDSQLGGAASFTAVNGSVSVLTASVNRAQINFVAAVGYWPWPSGNLFFWDTAASGRSYGLQLVDGRIQCNLNDLAATTGSKRRVLIAMDGTTTSLVNGSTRGPLPANAASGTGNFNLAQLYDGTFAGMRLAFLMVCSAVPNSTIRAAIEAKLIADF